MGDSLLVAMWRGAGRLVDIGGVGARRGAHDPMDAAARAMGEAFGAVDNALAAQQRAPFAQIAQIGSSNLFTLIITIHSSDAHVVKSLNAQVWRLVLTDRVHFVEEEITTDAGDNVTTVSLTVALSHRDIEGQIAYIRDRLQHVKVANTQTTVRVDQRAMRPASTT